MTTKNDMREIVDSLYGIASELTISTDKKAQEQGRQLRQLIGRLENSLNCPETKDSPA